MTPPDLRPLDDSARSELKRAVALLEHPGLAARMADLAGKPFERGLARLPARWHRALTRATEQAVQAALRLALTTLRNPAAAAGSEGDGPRPAAANAWHRAGVIATGAGAGFFGLPALMLELPLTTTLMMRSIADVARSEGADLGQDATRLDCVAVLMLGGPSTADDGSSLGYFAAREAFAQAVQQAARHLAAPAIGHTASPAVLRLIALVADRFGLQVSEKLAAQALPVIGAAGGAAINALFISHFQAMARGHFIVRRLERRHGPQLVQQAYAQLRAEPAGPAR